MSKKTKAKAKRKAQRELEDRRGIDVCCCGDETCDGTGPYPKFHRVGQKKEAEE